MTWFVSKDRLNKLAAPATAIVDTLSAHHPSGLPPAATATGPATAKAACAAGTAPTLARLVATTITAGVALLRALTLALEFALATVVVFAGAHAFARLGCLTRGVVAPNPELAALFCGHVLSALLQLLAVTQAVGFAQVLHQAALLHEFLVVVTGVVLGRHGGEGTESRGCERDHNTPAN
jgi:hypothetical protein